MFALSQGTCQTTEVEITVTRTTLDYASSEIFGLFDYTTDDPVYVSWNPADNSVETRTVCIPRVSTMLYTLFIANDTDTWNVCSGLEIFGPYGNRLFRRNPLGSVYLLSLIMPIEKNQEWVWTTTYKSDWLSGSTTEWDSGVPSSLPESDSTYYFRKSIQGMDYVSAYEFRILYRYGVVAYLNGVEVYRDNMPDGAITPETRCSKTYGSYDYRGTIRNGFEVHEDAVFAVEIHVSGSTSLQFDAWMAFYADSYSSSWPMNCYHVPASSVMTDGGENAAIFVDGSICTGAYYTVTLDSTYIEYTTETAQVNSWQINGDSDDAMSQFKVVNQPLSNTTWSTTTYSNEFTMEYGFLEQIPIGDYYSENANKYRLYPTKLLANPIILADLVPSVCYREYTLTRLQTPKYEESYSTMVGDFVEYIPENVDSLKCEISPALPAGLVLNECTIRGTPTESLSTTVFTVFYYDRIGTRSVEFSLTVEPSKDEGNLTWLIVLIVVIVVIIVAVVIFLLLNKKKGESKPKIPVTTKPQIVKPISADESNVSVPMAPAPIVPVTPASVPAPGPAPIVPVTPVSIPAPAPTQPAPAPAQPAPAPQVALQKSLIVALPSGDVVDLYTLPDEERQHVMNEMGII